MVTARNTERHDVLTLAQLVAATDHGQPDTAPSPFGAAIDGQTPVEDAHRYMCRRGLQELCVLQGPEVIGVVSLGEVRAVCADTVAEDVAANPATTDPRSPVCPSRWVWAMRHDSVGR